MVAIHAHKASDAWKRARRGLYLTSQLLRVHDALSAAGVPSIAFKGPTLSFTLYGDFASRDYLDIDVLVPRVSLISARRAIEGLGFRPILEVTESQLMWMTRFLNEYAFYGDDTVIELHWSIMRPGYSFALSYEALSTYRSTMEVAGRMLPVLRPEALLVVLAVHGSKHSWTRRTWLTDFALLAGQHTGIDWGLVFAIANEHGASRFLLQAAWLVKHHLHEPIPKALDRAMALDPAARAAGRLARRSLLRGRQSHLSHLAAMSDQRSRLRVLRKYCTDPTLVDCRLVLLPASLYPLYYFVRPLRLFGKQILRLDALRQSS